MRRHDFGVSFSGNSFYYQLYKFAHWTLLSFLTFKTDRILVFNVSVFIIPLTNDLFVGNTNENSV